MIDVMSRTSFDFDPARIHGHIKIELFDDKTKQLIQKIEHDNMVTNASKYILNGVAGGIPNQMQNLVMPVATRVLGGLMLFDEELDEDADNIHFPFGKNSDNNYTHLIAAAGRLPNANNPLLGSLNATESGPTATGYVSVWDFNTSQANGTIKAAALTLASENADTIPFCCGNNNYTAHNILKTNGQTDGVAQPLYYDTDSGMMYFTSTDSNMGYSMTQAYDPQVGTTVYTYTMTIFATYLPLYKYGVADIVNAYSIPAYVTTISWQDTVLYTPVFRPGYDGYAYFTYSAGNESGNGSFKYLSLAVDDQSFTLSSMISVTLTESYLLAGQYITFAEDYIWATTYDRTGIYRIRKSNTAMVDLYAFPTGFSAYDSGVACKGGGLNIMLYCPAANGQTGYYDNYDAIIYPDGTILRNGLYFSRSTARFAGGSRPGAHADYESPYLWTWGQIGSPASGSSYSGYGSLSQRYLGTIANLASTVTKNATQTLKVTYTLTDV